MSAILSDCGRYRYHLAREVDGRPGTILFIMLNPSTADAASDDPTIRRCLDFVRRWERGRLEVVNLFAWRATRVSALKKAAAPIGPDNDRHILDTADRASLTQGGRVVAAWGAHGHHLGRADHVRRILAGQGIPLWHLGLTARGLPRHPLFVRATQSLAEWP